MLKEADKFYGNVTRPIIELFLNYSTEYQIKRVNKVNNALIAKQNLYGPGLKLFMDVLGGLNHKEA